MIVYRFPCVHFVIDIAMIIRIDVCTAVQVVCKRLVTKHALYTAMQVVCMRVVTKHVFEQYKSTS